MSWKTYSNRGTCLLQRVNMSVLRISSKQPDSTADVPRPCPHRASACTPAPDVAALPQVFRTEHHSRKLGPEASLALMAVVLLTIMSMAAGAALATHPGQLQNLVRHPTLMRAALHTLSLKQLLPVFWTGLCSTDAVLLIEVRRCGRRQLWGFWGFLPGSDGRGACTLQIIPGASSRHPNPAQLACHWALCFAHDRLPQALCMPRWFDSEAMARHGVLS